MPIKLAGAVIVHYISWVEQLHRVSMMHGCSTGELRTSAAIHADKIARLHESTMLPLRGQHRSQSGFV